MSNESQVPELSFETRYPPIRAAWNVYRRSPERRAELLVAYAEKARQTPDSLWLYLFRSDPAAREVFTRLQASADASAAWTRYSTGETGSWRMLQLIQNECRARCCQLRPYGPLWDETAAQAWLGTIRPQDPEGDFDFARQIAEDHLKRRQRAAQLPVLTGTRQYRIRVPARFRWDEEQDSFVASDQYPGDALQEVESDYQEDMAGLETWSGHIPCRHTTLKLEPDHQNWCFDFWILPEATEAALVKWLSGQLSDGWGEDLARYERLIGTDVLIPGFDGEPNTWEVRLALEP